MCIIAILYRSVFIIHPLGNVLCNFLSRQLSNAESFLCYIDGVPNFDRSLTCLLFLCPNIGVVSTRCGLLPFVWSLITVRALLVYGLKGTWVLETRIHAVIELLIALETGINWHSARFLLFTEILILESHALWVGLRILH